MEVVVKDIKGKETGRKVSLSDSIFSVEPNDHAIYLDVKQYLANQRQGTHKTKEKAEVNYSTKKIKKQKGTGTARAGSRKSPIFVGGGRIFGPKPRNYSFKLNKKLKSLARKSALSYKVKDNNLSVLENFSLDAPKTKDYSEILKGLKLSDKKTLLVIPAADDNIILSARNLPRTRVTTVNRLNTYEVLNADSLVITEDGLKKLEELFS